MAPFTQSSFAFIGDHADIAVAPSADIGPSRKGIAIQLPTLAGFTNAITESTQR